VVSDTLSEYAMVPVVAPAHSWTGTWRSRTVNPQLAQVRALAQALGKRAKTDPIDAAVIAHFAEATSPELRALPDEATRLLGEMLTHRKQIVRMIVAQPQRQQALTDPQLKKSVTRLLKALQRELKSLDKDLDDRVRKTPAWREKDHLLSLALALRAAQRGRPRIARSRPNSSTVSGLATLWRPTHFLLCRRA
jgi:transposase